jgi:hypothetical protein
MMLGWGHLGQLVSVLHGHSSSSKYTESVYLLTWWSQDSNCREGRERERELERVRKSELQCTTFLVSAYANIYYCLNG